MSSKKILVIDDEELLIRTMIKFLEKLGYEVYSVKNGRDAEAIVEEEDFDLLICDIRMPGKSGVEVVKSIKHFTLTKNKKEIPVIFITGFADEKMEKEAKALKPAAYLTKPFDVEEILRSIQKAIS